MVLKLITVKFDEIVKSISPQVTGDWRGKPGCVDKASPKLGNVAKLKNEECVLCI